MKHYLTIFLIIPFFNLSAQDIPLGYIQYFDADFSKQIPQQFETSTYAIASIKNQEIQFSDTPDTSNAEVPKASILVKNLIFGDLLAEINVKVSGNYVDTLTGLYVISGKRDESNYYFIHINEMGTRLYKKYRDEISLIQYDSSFTFKKNTWETLSIRRNILSRDITIKCNGSETVFNDPNLVMGKLGLGVNDYNLIVKKLTVWAPTAIKIEED